MQDDDDDVGDEGDDVSMMISTFLRVVGFFRGAVVAVGHLDWNADHLFPGLCLVIRG